MSTQVCRICRNPVAKEHVQWHLTIHKLTAHTVAKDMENQI